MKPFLSVLLLLSLAACATAQAVAPHPSTIPELEKASKSPQSRHDEILALWRRLATINSPSGQENERATAVLGELKKSGYTTAFRDAAGNVLSAPIDSGKGAVVFAAHMDTVVQPGSAVTLRDGHNQQGTTLIGPGSGDDASGIVTLLATAHALRASDFRPKRPVIFFFSVNEERAGTGTEAFFQEHAKDISGYVAVDSSPIDTLGAIADYGTGFFRLEVTFSGAGVHTIESYGVPSTTQAMAIAIENLYRLQREIPQGPVEKRSWLNIGLVKAGTAPNSMATTAYFSLDLRCNDQTLGAELQKKATVIVEDAARTVGVQVKVSPQLFPPLRLDTPAARHLRAVLEESYREVGVQPYTGYIGASDYLRALQVGVPGAGIGATNITHMHSAEEVSEVEPIFLGTRAVIGAAVRLGSE